MPSELLVGRIANGLLIRVVGHGTMHESIAFRATAESSPDSEVVIFDTTRCEYLDSTFLGCLVGIHRACQRMPKRRFVIAAAGAARAKLFSTSSLDQYFDFVDICPEPLDQFTRVDIDKLDAATLGQHVMGCHQRLADQGGREASAFRSIAARLAEELGDGTPD